MLHFICTLYKFEESCNYRKLNLLYVNQMKSLGVPVTIFYNVAGMGDFLVKYKSVNCLLHEKNYDFMAKMFQICWNF